MSTVIMAIVLICQSVSLAEPPNAAKDGWQRLDPIVRATNRGVALMERYEYAEAVKVFEQVLKLAPSSAEARVNLAIALWNRSAKEDLQRAEKLFEGVIHDEPENVRALYFRGITHQYSGRDEQAISLFERVLKIAPHDACNWYLLARSKSHLGQSGRAELERAIKINPALASAYYDLMRVAAQEGKQDEVKAYQEKFVKLRQSPLAEMVTLPHYRQMGPLAVVRPMSARPRRNVTSGELSAGPTRTLLQGLGVAELPANIDWTAFFHAAGIAMADVSGDGLVDVASIVPTEGPSQRLVLLLRRPDGTFVDATKTSGLAAIGGPLSSTFGDYDNDNIVDLFIGCIGPNHLFRGRGDGTFEDVTAKTRTAGPDCVTRSAAFLDADHDGDLDIYVCNEHASAISSNRTPGANQLLNNNADGTFTDITVGAGVACADDYSFMMTPADIDGDRDTDLVVFNLASPIRVFFNDRLGKYHEGRITEDVIKDSWGGVLQDFNGDGRPDLLIQPGPRVTGRLYLSDGTATLKPSPAFHECSKTLTTWGDIFTTRVIDVDLDGDLDIAVFGKVGHLLLNDGWGRFVVRPNVWPKASTKATVTMDLADMTGDGIPDLLRVTAANGGTVELIPTKLTPPANWLAITPTGDRGDDKRTRSPNSGFGTKIELRCGLHSQVMTYTGLNGGLSQSCVPLVFGLNGATKADYVAFTWPDGVTQCENELAANTHHRISEMERRVSSCPVLFAWDGRHFGFIGDFAGVGGLGYYVAPGEYAPPQVIEHVLIKPEQLAAKDGLYELRVCEPMEEVAYVDRLELVAVDHPREHRVYPDERLVLTGPPATHKLLCPARPIFPMSATGPNGTECAERLTKADRVYAYQPKLDRRFIGFCEPHTLELDFGDRLAGLPADRSVYLFLTGSIEYPYSQTTFAAAQAGVTWQPMKVERQVGDGRWETIVPDAGAPGGMGRTIAINLTGKLPPPTGNNTCGTGVSPVSPPPRRRCHTRLRITTNLEIYFDQAFIGTDRGTDGLAIRTVPMAAAHLRRLGFPMEYSPDGQHPTTYTYDVIEPTSSFKTPRGAYTRYGPVESLLGDFDDRYVILGTGDEIAVSFDANALPPPGAGRVRSFILVSHAYCKDMDLYTAEPDTVEPLPFRDMSRYPYPQNECHPMENTLNTRR